MKSKILITGASGFIGSKLLTHFSKENWVIGVDDASTGKHSMKMGQDQKILDLSNAEGVMGLPDVDLILHFAGQSSGEASFDNPTDDGSRNLLTTASLAKRYRGTKTRFIHASSMAVYGNCELEKASELSKARPISPYGISKLAAEQLLHLEEFELDAVSLRISNVYGPGQDLSRRNQGMVSIYAASALGSDAIEVKGSLSRQRDFIHVKDVVRVVDSLAKLPVLEYNVVNVGTGDATSVADLLQIIQDEVGSREIIELPGTPGDQFKIVPDVTSLRQVIDVSTFLKLEVGVPEFLTWAKGFSGKKGSN